MHPATPPKSRCTDPFLATLLAGLGSTLLGCASSVDPAGPRPLEIRGHAAADPRDVPPPIGDREPTTVHVDLVAQEMVAGFNGQDQAWIWTFNGTVPGPMVRVREGDSVELELTNANTGNIEPHSIDLHAVMGPGGGHAVTEIEPGERATLEFRAQKAGTYIYHCAAEGMPWEHIAYGMYGLIVVEPPGGLDPIDHEYYVAQSEWYTKPAGKHDEHGIPADVLVLDEEQAFAERPTFFTLNGHVDALTNPELFGEAIRVSQGESVRIFFANAGPNLASSFHVVGGIFDRVFTGPPSEAVHDEETVLVPPGSAATFELTMPVPGDYPMVDHALFRAARGAMGLLHVDAEGEWPDDIYSPRP